MSSSAPTDDATDPSPSPQSETAPSGDSSSDVEPVPPEVTPPPSSEPTVPGDDGTHVGELDKVRDLIVGDHAREMSERIDRLEDRVADQLGALRTDLQKQIDGLDTFAREEQESLADRVADLKKTHREGVVDLEKRVQDLKRELTDARDELEDTLGEVERDFRDKLREQKKELNQELSDQHAELSSMLEEAVSQIRDDSTDRRDLATLFEQVATHLRE